MLISILEIQHQHINLLVVFHVPPDVAYDGCRAHHAGEYHTLLKADEGIHHGPPQVVDEPAVQRCVHVTAVLCK